LVRPWVDQPPGNGDIGYLASPACDGDRIIVHIRRHPQPRLTRRGGTTCRTTSPSCNREIGDQPFSVGSAAPLDDLTVTDSEILTGPHPGDLMKVHTATLAGGDNNQDRVFVT